MENVSTNRCERIATISKSETVEVGGVDELHD